MIKAKDSKEEFAPKTYRTIIEVEDWGPAITKLIVNLGEEISENSLISSAFDVFVERRETRDGIYILGDSKGYRTVTNAYISDESGNRVNGSSNFVILEMEYGPALSLSSPMNFNISNFTNDWIESEYTITQVEDVGTISGLVINQSSGETRVLVDRFSTGKATYGDSTLTYADYAPAEANNKNRLIVWLHGMGEGGTDPTITLAGNKVVNFITDEVQEYFRGAYVLSPQTPTYWMDGFESFGDGTSKYQEALMSLIEDYVANNPDIDPNKVYIGGISNGGYMTMLMIRDYPEYFASAFVAAEALDDELITEEDLNNIAQTPIWFVHTANDPTVNPETTVLPTYDRLVDAGADVHLSYYDDVRDLSGLYTNEDGSPYEYNGHWSWIYLYNNDPSTVIDGEEISILEWVTRYENEAKTYDRVLEDKDSDVEDTGSNGENDL
ncbi:prolyl oligopeptidase family serine peptidase [Bacillaceae bacterium IKA-2]|nr:prolyl oligopeptidase family serine peptidase [Bacillaceae bacterium IKA-2]